MWRVEAPALDQTDCGFVGKAVVEHWEHSPAAWRLGTRLVILLANTIMQPTYLYMKQNSDIVGPVGMQKDPQMELKQI